MEPILAPSAQLAATGSTCAKRLAHSRLVVMMMTSLAFMAAARVFDGSIGTAMEAMHRLTW
jgi:predicted Rossmann-fold nucleotide-binding protein